MSRWLPLWQLSDGTATRAPKAPNGSLPDTDIIFGDEIVAIGSISVGGILSENIQEYMSNHELQWLLTSQDHEHGMRGLLTIAH